MTVRVGVIGAGNIGANHVAVLHGSVTGAEVGAVADIDLARARAAAEPAGARALEDAAALIADPAVDAVVIASHDSTHAALARACVDAGKPVLCEKPLAPTVAECAALVEADETHLISVGFMRRFDPAYRDMKLALDAATHGAALLLHCVSRGVSAPGATTEYGVIGAAIHEFDCVPWLLGSPIAEVSWHAARPSAMTPGIQDPQVMLLRTADGALTTLEIFLNAGYGYDVRCEVVCEQGTLALVGPGRVVTDHGGARSTNHHADWRPRFAEAYRLELQAWVDALAAGASSPLPTAQDGLVATAVAEAVIASMRDGGRVVAVA